MQKSHCHSLEIEPSFCIPRHHVYPRHHGHHTENEQWSWPTASCQHIINYFNTLLSTCANILTPNLPRDETNLLYSRTSCSLNWTPLTARTMGTACCRPSSTSCPQSSSPPSSASTMAGETCTTNVQTSSTPLTLLCLFWLELRSLWMRRYLSNYLFVLSGMF